MVKNWYMGVMREVPRSFSDIKSKFEDFPETDCAVFISYAMETFRGFSSKTAKTIIEPAELEVIALSTFDTPKFGQMTIDEVLSFIEFASEENAIVAVDIGYWAVRHYMEKMYGIKSVNHLLRKMPKFSTNGPLRQRHRSETTQKGNYIPSSWGAVHEARGGESKYGQHNS